MMKTLLEQIDERLALCAKATPGPWEMHVSLARVELFMGIHTFRSPTFDYMRSLERAEKDGIFCVQSRNQREGELAALKESLRCIEQFRSQNHRRGYPTGPEWMALISGAETAVAQITKLMGAA